MIQAVSIHQHEVRTLCNKAGIPEQIVFELPVFFFRQFHNFFNHTVPYGEFIGLSFKDCL